MAVVIVPKFSKADIKKLLNKRRQLIRDAIISRLQFVGEQFVRNARDGGSYMDRTGNLRSSIGYVVIYNGKQLFENFLSKGGKEGEEKARKVVDEVRNEYPKGFVLIGVAGMEYAAAVESRGYDVITTSSLKAETSLKDALKKISTKIGKLK
jgi:hypothetical protein